MTTTQTAAEILTTVDSIRLCCRFDQMYNMGATCDRAVYAYMLHGDADAIRQAQKRLPRLRSEYRQRNLAKWIDDRTDELACLVGWFGSHLCENGNSDQHSVTDALTPCTCGE